LKKEVRFTGLCFQGRSGGGDVSYQERGATANRYRCEHYEEEGFEDSRTKLAKREKTKTLEEEKR